MSVIWVYIHEGREQAFVLLSVPSIHYIKSLVIQGHIVNCPDTPKQIGYGLDMETLGNICNFTSYCGKIIFTTSKIFERFCTEIPKIKHCHEYTKEDFSQSSYKEVIWYIFFSNIGRFRLQDLLVKTRLTRTLTIWFSQF